MADFQTQTGPAPADAAEAAGGRILLVEDDDLVRQSVARMLTCAGHEVVDVSDGEAALQRLGSGRFDLMLADLKMPGMTGIELVSATRQARPDLPVVLMTTYAGVRTAVEAMRRGAYDYIQKPFEREDLVLLVRRTLEHSRLRAENLALREAAGVDAPPRPLIGSGQAIREVRTLIDRLASSDSAVLISGESGTGRQVVARIIHARSTRAARPILAVNCAALSETLLERELFGYDKGAVAGAGGFRRGRIEQADGGTLLLNEIAAIAAPLQGRLLRVLQEQAFERVGSGATQRADVRVIATTSRRLELAVARGDFREDLYYRLNVLPLQMPPLRERREDIPELVRHFLHCIARRDGQPFRHIEPAALRLLQKYSWPGNVRELQNILERVAVIEREPGRVRSTTLAPWLAGEERKNAGRDPLDHLPLAEVERRVILDTLAKFEGHRARTAGALGIGVRTLGIKLKKWREDGQLIESNGQ